MHLRIFVIAAVLAAAAPPGARAACEWTWDCSAGPGQCRQVPVCDSAIDLPPVRPAEIAPIPAPTIRPIPALTLPPLGTNSCQPAYLCDGTGRCGWQTLCR